MLPDLAQAIRAANTIKVIVAASSAGSIVVANIKVIWQLWYVFCGNQTNSKTIKFDGILLGTKTVS